MSEVATHCPYIGLKQNRAIRFSTSTAEHRCYISGDAMDIPVDQASYCLTQFHTQCPLYMGSVASHNRAPASTGAPRKATSRYRDSVVAMPSADAYEASPDVYEEDWASAQRAARRAAASLPRRSGGIPTSVYGLVIGLLVVGAVVYFYAGTLLGPSAPSDAAAVNPTQAAFEPLPTVAPTDAAVLPPMSDTPVPTPPPPTTATSAAAVIPPVASPTTPAQPTAAPAQPNPTAPAATTVPATPEAKDMVVRLVYGDASGQLLVPVLRTISVPGKKVATSALAALFTDPRNGLSRILLPDTQILSVAIVDGTAVIDFNKRPTGPGDVRGFAAIALTMYQFDSINKIKFLINGVDMPAENGIPYVKTNLVNLWNPSNLSLAGSTAVTVSFVAANSKHDVSLTKLIDKTVNVAEATARTLLEGPGQYSAALKRVIPESTQLRGIRIENGVVTVDFTQPFASATDKAAVVRTVASTMTTINGIKAVQILVEGAPLSTVWGNDYNKNFERPPVNAE
ncbi:MAG: hypothetical protein DWI55_01815 [Chloroflexi bacterium]|nr:MAG: hypothetical protein DWI55_01815 [Chloroflexota bacterium]